MKNKVFTLLVVGFFVFNGCCVQYENIIPSNFAQKIFSLYEKNQHYLLIATCQDVQCFFSLVDSFGSPIVSRKYQNGVFSNTKFLPPSSKYDSFFYEIIKNPNLSIYEDNQITIKAINE